MDVEGAQVDEAPSAVPDEEEEDGVEVEDKQEEGEGNQKKEKDQNDEEKAREELDQAAGIMESRSTDMLTFCDYLFRTMIQIPNIVAKHSKVRPLSFT